MAPVEKDPSAGLNGALAAVLRGERAAGGLTQDQLAEASGIPLVSLQRYLSGKRAIDVSALHAIADGLGLSAGDLIAAAQARLGRVQAQAARDED